VVVLIHTTSLALPAADKDVAESDVMIRCRSTASDADLQADCNIFIAVEHVFSDGCSTAQPILALWQHGDDNIVAGYLAKGVVIIVVS